MDKLAKVAAVTVVGSGALVASVLSYAVLKATASEPRVRMGRTVPAFEAAFQIPDTPLLAPMAEPKAIETAPPPAKPDLASAMSAAPKPAPKKAPTTPGPAPAAVTEPDRLELGFKAPARESNLGERAVKSARVQQVGGAERQRRESKDEGDRVSFEVDLAAPR